MLAATTCRRSSTASKLVRRHDRRLDAGIVVDHEESPGDECRPTQALEQFVRDHAWGHHASCTCAIGPEASATACCRATSRSTGPSGCASSMPRCSRESPGLFIVSAIYMIGEKAADVIIADAKAGR